MSILSGSSDDGSYVGNREGPLAVLLLRVVLFGLRFCRPGGALPLLRAL
jgi:hypothetical protein